MKFALKDIRPNPFRRIEKYPIDQEKVDALKESISTTEFWDNIVARMGEDGKPELAYGHHRLEALKQLFPGTHEVSLIIRKLTDAQMIQIMARENNESFKTNSLVLLESVRATVQAYADGRISVEEMPVGTKTRIEYLRNAPSFIAGQPSEGGPHSHPYTIDSIAAFLGMQQKSGQASKRIQAAVSALELIEQGYLTELRLRDIGTDQLFQMVRTLQQHRDAAIAETERKRREAEAAAERAKHEQEQLEKQRKKAAEAAEAKRKQLEAAKDKEANAQRKRQELALAEAKQKEQAIAAKKKAVEVALKQAQAERLARQMKETAAKAKTVIREMGQHLTEQLKDGKITVSESDYVAREKRRELEPEKQQRQTKDLPDINRTVAGVLKRIEKLLSADDELQYRIKEFIKYRDDLDKINRRDLGKALSDLAERASQFAAKF